MNPEQNPKPPDPNARCSECGAYGAIEFGDVLLCPDCIVAKGSCCPEFGKDDLWRQRDDLPERPS